MEMEKDTQTPTFAELGLDPRILGAIERLGFTEPTPIQAEAIVPLLAGHDVIGRARTGSGKTAAFGLPLLHRVRTNPGPGVRALVLAPTRELALQVSDALRTYAEGLGVEILTIYGGASYGPQLAGLRQDVPVVVGTPGRLIDHLERGSLDLSTVDVVVLDEADEMLRMGFIDDVERLLGATPSSRQVALFSATMPAAIRRIAQAHLRAPLEIQVEAGALTVEHIEQRWLAVPSRFKHEALVRVLRAEPRDATLVFARTRASCDQTARDLGADGFSVEALHGDLSQAAREQVVERLRGGRTRIVVATDVAARGIDIEQLSHVINYDLPGDIETYVHRIGRTGRAGRHGVALTFVTPRERGFLRALERRLGQTPTQAEVPSDAEIVRRQRATMQRELTDTLIVAEDRGHDVHGAVQELCEASGWEPAELAAAAIGLLARERNINLRTDIDDEPPAWSRRREPRPAPPRPTARPRPAPGPRPRPSDSAVFLATGRRRGVRPGDIVGALTNGAGFDPSVIGRITILEHKTFVEMPREAAQALVTAVPALFLRGEKVRIEMAHPGALEQGQASERPARGKSRPTRGKSGNKGYKSRS